MNKPKEIGPRTVFTLRLEADFAVRLDELAALGRNSRTKLVDTWLRALVEAVDVATPRDGYLPGTSAVAWRLFDNVLHDAVGDLKVLEDLRRATRAEDVEFPEAPKRVKGKRR